MKFLQIDQSEKFLNISAIVTVQFLTQSRTETLHAHGLPDIPMQRDKEILGAEVTMINGPTVKIQAETASKLKQIIIN